MSQTCFEFHGLHVEIQSELPEVLAIFSDRLNQHISAPASKTDIHVRILPIESAGLPEPDLIRSQLHWIRTVPFHGDYSETQFLLTDGFSVACSNFASSTVTYGINPRSPRDPNSFIRTFLWLPLLAALHARGVLYLHASFVRLANRNLLFFGNGGSGKSTIAAALLSEGGAIVTDDNVLFSMSRDSVLGTPFEPEIHLDRTAALQIGVTGSGPGKDRKLRIALSALPSDRRATSAIPTDVILLRGDGPDNMIEEPRSSFLTQCVEDNPLLLIWPELTALHFRLIHRLTSSTRGWSLTLQRGGPPNLKDLGRRMAALLGETENRV